MQINEVKYAWISDLKKRNRTNLIVLHHAESGSCTPQDIHKWHINRGWSGIGYHYFVRKDGSIWSGRPEDTVGAHALNYNQSSIGICFEGRYQIEYMPEEQVKAGQELVEYLRHKYGITDIKRHCEVCNTDCPGKNFPFDRIVNRKSENYILSFQLAAQADGFQFPKYGADGRYGRETASVMKQCIVKKRIVYKYKNATKLVQRLLDLPQDGLCGKETHKAIKEFQMHNRLNVDGAVGFYTWQKLLRII